MAVTSIHSIKSTLFKAIEYIVKPEKTNGGKLVSYVGCYGDQFQCEKDFFDIRDLGTGRGKVLAQHLHQSFKPGEVTPDQAHLLGMQLADELLGGEYQYIIATHIDKNHIHNHIIFNNIGHSHLRSFEYKDNRGGKVFEKIRKLNDKICKENNLSIVENPELGSGKSRFEWMMNKEGQSWKSKLKFEIDNIIMESDSFEDFLANCKKRNIECVYRPENQITLKFRMQGQPNFCRAKTLGWWYDEPQIRRRIEQYQQIKEGHSFAHKKSKFIDTSTDKFKNEKYLKRWADIQNMKEASRLLNYLTEHSVSSQEDLEDTAIMRYGERVQLVSELNKLQKQIDELSRTIKAIEIYQEYKPYHDDYRNSKHKRKYEKENAEALKKYDSIKQKLLIKFPDKKLPNIEQLYDDREDLILQRNEKNTQYKKVVSELKELDQARSEIQNYITGIDKAKGKEMEIK